MCVCVTNPDHHVAEFSAPFCYMCMSAPLLDAYGLLSCVYDLYDVCGPVYILQRQATALPSVPRASNTTMGGPLKMPPMRHCNKPTESAC